MIQSSTVCPLKVDDWQRVTGRSWWMRSSENPAEGYPFLTELTIDHILQPGYDYS